jgi:hypothetical protein
MQPPAIQAALDNLVETIRTSLMAEFLELLRDGKPAPLKRSRKSSSAKKKATKARRPRKAKTAK